MRQGQQRFAMRLGVAAHWSAAALLWLTAWLAAPLQAADTGFQIQSPYLIAADGVYTLHARLQFTVPAAVEKAIRDGATLNLTLQLRFDRVRHWWTNEAVAGLEQHYELMYHRVSERFLVRNVNSGAQLSFAGFDDAVASLREVDALPVLDASLLAAGEEYEVSLRAAAEVRTIPRALGMLLFWIDDFSLRSDWYTWPLKP